MLLALSCSCAIAVVADSAHSAGGSSAPMTIPPEGAPLTDCIPPSSSPAASPAAGRQGPQPAASMPMLPIMLFTPVGIRSSVSSPGAGEEDGSGSKAGAQALGEGAWGASVEVVGGAVGGQARLQGTLQGMVYCHSRDTFGRGVAELKVGQMVLERLVQCVV